MTCGICGSLYTRTRKGRHTGRPLKESSLREFARMDLWLVSKKVIKCPNCLSWEELAQKHVRGFDTKKTKGAFAIILDNTYGNSFGTKLLRYNLEEFSKRYSAWLRTP